MFSNGLLMKNFELPLRGRDRPTDSVGYSKYLGRRGVVGRTTQTTNESRARPVPVLYEPINFIYDSDASCP